MTINIIYMQIQRDTAGFLLRNGSYVAISLCFRMRVQSESFNRKLFANQNYRD